jgi:subtilisin family serine protease
MKKNYQRWQIRMILGIITITLCVFFPVKSTNATIHSPDKVIKGERPPIDIASIPDEAIEQGIIRIKFNKTLENYLDNMMISSNPDGTVRFGIAGIDQLNQQFGVFQVGQTFSAALQNSQYISRHRLWGFHLWFDLIIPAGTDIRSMVMAYADKNEIEVSEPVFRKRLIGADINAIPDESASSGDAGLNYIPNDPRYNEQWHYHNTGQQSGTVDADIDLPEAWDITKGNSSVIVAVIDQGISFTHTDLAANMWPGNGYNFVNNSSTLSPGDHGTHVAGTIAANTNNGTGVSGIAGGTGTGNGVRLMSCQVFNPGSGSGGFENAAVWAADNGAAISQNSWGYTSAGYYEQVVLNSIDYFNANGGGTVLNGGITIYAAGNNGTSGLYYPGCYSGSFSVAATNNQDIKAWYSNYDTWVDISAPGGDTEVITARGVLSTLTGNTYGFYQGTSMACPHTSGVAALIISLAPGVLTPQDVKTILTTTTDNIYPLNPTYTGKLGSGRLNAYQALLTTQGYINPLLPAAPVSLTATAISTSQINLNWAPNAANDVVMLAWNTTNTFGVPTGNYSTGQTISGGGTVLYEGTLASFQHLMLNAATPYFYALWSKNGGYYSAVSRKANATTLCGTISTFPWNEGFENGGIIPNCWTQERVANSGIDWTFITGNGGSNPSGAHTGTYNACLKDNTTASNLTKLITPPINLTGLSGPTLTFWHTQAFWSPDQDQLIVYYKASAAGPWVSLATYTTNITSWTQRTISLPAASGDYYIAFEGNAKYGYGVCVDDVSITGTASPTLTVTPANQNVSPAAGTTPFTVTSNSNWTAASNQSWCAVTPSGSGNGTITATFEVNNTSSSRVANVTVNVTGLPAVVVTVTQAAPVLTVSPSNQSVAPAAGTTDFAVTSNTNWAANSNQSWCTITPSGSGNGTITATYAVNNTVSSRVANITVNVSGLSPVVVTVTQAAPTLTVSPLNQAVSASAGTTDFTVTSNTNWTLSSNQSWCTVNPSGSGSGTITATFSGNNTTSQRIASITVIVSGLSPVVVTVTQAGLAPTLTVTPANQNVTTAAGNTAFTVTSNSSWTAISDQTWCTVTPSGSGNGSITATYTANPTVNTRVAQVTVVVSGLPQVVVTVTQAGSEFMLTALNLVQTAPNILEFDVYLLDADPNVPFELASIQLGFLINSGIYTGGTLTASYNNTGSGLIPAQQFAAAASVVSSLSGYPNLTLLRLAGRTPPGAGNGTIISPVNPTLITRFTLTSSVPFTSGSTANLTFTSNTVSIPLYGTKVAAYISGINTQLPVTPGFNAIISENPILNGPPSLSVTPVTQSVAINAGMFDYTVTSNAAWTAVSDQPWCVVSPSGYGNGNMTATFSENTGASRTANITVSVSAEQSVTVTLVQDGVTTKTLNINALLEGLYAGSGTMRQAADENGPHFAPGVADHITVELHNVADYSIIEHTINGVELSTNGNATINIPPALNGNYYITIKHRNSIETTSSDPVSFAPPVINYAFSSPTNVFGGNLQMMVDGAYTIFGGDVNQDGVVDTADMTPVDNDSDAYMAGYIDTDVNGDGGVDTADMTIVDNNSADYVESAHP